MYREHTNTLKSSIDIFMNTRDLRNNSRVLGGIITDLLTGRMEVCKNKVLEDMDYVGASKSRITSRFFLADEVNYQRASTLLDSISRNPMDLA